MPFLVTKLAIKTLPCVIGFVDGTTKMKWVGLPLLALGQTFDARIADRIVGFDELPGGDNFATSTLEQGMEECGESPGSPAFVTFLYCPS